MNINPLSKKTKKQNEKPIHPPERQRRFRNLTTDIKQQKTVLLLGLEIVNIKGVTVRQTLRDQLAATNAEDIAHYYERDSYLRSI
ncbi:MAG: hypothetical protein JNL70_21030 [Saprospiraceae bacterium]|nr:hypothetical protein [Saprospiraceae bacterium]